MWLNKLFIEETIDMERRCKQRIMIGIILMLLGAASGVAAYICLGEAAKGGRGADVETYVVTGLALIAAGVMSVMKNLRCLKDENLLKERALVENDERNRMMGLRCWSYTGYTMFLLLYIGVLVSGFFNEIVMRTLLAVIGVFALVLLIFRRYLGRVM